MLDQRHSYAPRQWVLEHMTCRRRLRSLRSGDSAVAARAGEPWTPASSFERAPWIRNSIGTLPIALALRMTTGFWRPASGDDRRPAGLEDEKIRIAARRTILIATEVNRSPYPTRRPRMTAKTCTSDGTVFGRHRYDCCALLRVPCCRYCPFVID
jgi:hypothetical protein